MTRQPLGHFYTVFKKCLISHDGYKSSSNNVTRCTRNIINLINLILPRLLLKSLRPTGEEVGLTKQAKADTAT